VNGGLCNTNWIFHESNLFHSNSAMQQTYSQQKALFDFSIAH